MTHHVQANRKIPIAADKLWDTVNRMTGMEAWYPSLIRESEVQDADSSQPKRVCIMQDGGELKERIILRDDATRTFSYAIDSHPLPAKNVVGTIRIDDLEDGTSHVSWSANMILDPASSEQISAMVQGMYENGLASLEEHHKQ
ncbi:SRPBCC family protein [Roseobacteraceae bacterium S113]